jgi:glutamate--cysteine ligase
MIQEKSLLNWFEIGSQKEEFVGLELEMWVLDRTTGNQLPFKGARGMEQLLSTLYNEVLESQGWSKEYVEEQLLGLSHPSGAAFSLEPGCALEYSSATHKTITSLLSELKGALENVVPKVHALQAALVLLGKAPFGTNGPEDWIVKSRVQTQHNYFKTQAAGHAGTKMMSTVCSLQLCYDFLNHNDLIEKLKVSYLLVPLGAALFANSTIAGGKVSSIASKRQEIWLETDSLRTGCPPGLFDKTNYNFQEYVDWILDMPLMFYVRNNRYHPLPRKPFREWMNTVLPDNSLITLEDFNTHLSSVFPDVRVRQYIEMRAFDAPRIQDLPAVVTFFTVALYDREVRKELLKRIPKYTNIERYTLFHHIAHYGMQAFHGKKPLSITLLETLNIIAHGVRERVQQGTEETWIEIVFNDFIDSVKNNINNKTRLNIKGVIPRPDEHISVTDVLNYAEVTTQHLGLLGA